MRKWTAALLLLTSLAWAKPAFQAKKLQEAGKATAQTMAYSATIRYPDCPAGRALARQEMADFHKNLKDVGAPAADHPMAASLELDYQVVYSGPSLSSLYISGSSDFAGQVRPAGAQADRRLALEQRLKDGDPEWITKGTEASADNYKVVLPLAKQLRVIFTDYQVTSHAEGPQEVLVPYSVLRSEIDPKGPLAFALQ